MNGSLALIDEFAHRLVDFELPDNVTIVLLPPVGYLESAAKALRGSPVEGATVGIENDADTAAVDATVFYRLPYADGRYQILANVLWGESDSDIDFHDVEANRMALLLQYSFGDVGRWAKK